MTIEYSPPEVSHKKTPIVFLLALWGESYIENFFNFSLCSLLAPGNIPALHQEFECTFLFLTKRANIIHFKTQAAFAQLASYCSIEFIEISDLIFDGSYSATLTLAFERGMRSRGKQMLSTYFFFLVSDYIMANGSFKNLSVYLRQGYSGITSGNFLVVEEYVSPFLQTIRDASEGIISINPRELLSLAFPHLHPVSIAHTVTQNLTYATHGNRLFWKVDDSMMIGRFYLRHMLCIKPETDQYKIGSSCDYSFIPEMCPSGNVIHIQDSDECCTIEMAAYDYEEKWIAKGPYKVDKLAEQLSTWTTCVHRANAYIPMVYHTQELVEPPHQALSASLHFVKSVEKKLSPTPHPIRGHYYWVSCIESIFHSLLKDKKHLSYLNEKGFAGVIGSPPFSFLWDKELNDQPLLSVTHPPSSLPLTKKAQRKAKMHRSLLGRSPHSLFWHAHWTDDKHLRHFLHAEACSSKKGVVIASEPIGSLIPWFETTYPKNILYQFSDFLLKRNPEDLQTIFKGREFLFIWMTDEDFCKLGHLIRRCTPYLPHGTSILVYLKHARPLPHKKLKQRIVTCCSNLLATKVICKRTTFRYNSAKIYLEPLLHYFAHKLFAPRKHFLNRAIGAMGISILSLATIGLNMFSSFISLSKKRSTSTALLFKILS